MATEIQTWLEGLGLRADAPNYATNFEQEGIEEKDQLSKLDLTVQDLDKLGIKIAHRAAIMSGIRQLRNISPPPSTDDIAKARFDLVVRFVAVVISVGFATRLAQICWLNTGTFPNPLELQELLRLGTALFVIIAGWEWYHRDVFNFHREELGGSLSTYLSSLSRLCFC